MAETTGMTDSWRAESWGWKDARTAERSEQLDGCWAELMVERAAKRAAGSAAMRANQKAEEKDSK